MGGVEDSIRAAMLLLLKDFGYDAVEVLDWDESIQYGGYCETCAYDYMAVTITFREVGGKVSTHEVEDSFGKLITRLSAYDV